MRQNSCKTGQKVQSSVFCGKLVVTAMNIVCGVSQGSALIQILFIMYTIDLVPIVTDHGLFVHHYAYDSQIYGFCQPTATATLSSDITECVNSLSSLMWSNWLQLDADKTEVMWCASTRRLPQLPSCTLSVAGVFSCAAWSASVIPGSVGSCRRSAWPMFFNITVATSPSTPPCNCWL